MELEVEQFVLGVTPISDIFSLFSLDGPGVPLNPPSERPHKRAGPSAHSAHRAPRTEKPIEGIWGE